MTVPRGDIEQVVRRYYDGCNKADVDKMISCLSPDAVHYFPVDAPQGPFFGARAIAEGWVGAVRTLGSQWTIDLLLIDEHLQAAIVEWTHFKSKVGVHLRGLEVCDVAESGLISEIRAYYGCPVADPTRSWELGQFDYAGRGYPVDTPEVDAGREGPT